MSVQGDLSQKVGDAIEYMGSNGADLDTHYTWLLGELLDRLGPSDLTPQEKIAVVAVLNTAHARKLSARNSAEATAKVGMLSQSRLRLVAPLRPPSAQRRFGCTPAS